jgi:uncharacterized membrane protein YcfT
MNSNHFESVKSEKLHIPYFSMLSKSFTMPFFTILTCQYRANIRYWYNCVCWLDVSKARKVCVAKAKMDIQQDVAMAPVCLTSDSQYGP